jgi:hypothetical protein
MEDNMDIKLIFLGVNIGKEIAGCLGIIETMSSKIDKLCNADFEAGVLAMIQAKISSNEKKTLLREARQYFTKAVSLEKDERLAACYLGLAFCHKNLGDENNFILALQTITTIHIEGKTKAQILGFIENPIFSIAFGGTDSFLKYKSHAMSEYEEREVKLGILRENIQKYLET